MSLTKAGVAIRKSNRIGMAAAVYACDGKGSLMREDYRTAKEARAAARAVNKRSGWAISERLATEDIGDVFDAQPAARSAPARRNRF